MEKNIVLCDTNILIEFYKNNPNIVAQLNKIGAENIAISAVSAGELLFGALNKREVLAIKKDIEHLILLHTNDLVSKKFMELMFTYSKSHGLAVPDALIAATAMVNEIPLYTLNMKDFKFIENLFFYK